MSEVSLRVMVERPSIPFSDIYRGFRLLFPYDHAVVHFLV